MHQKRSASAKRTCLGCRRPQVQSRRPDIYFSRPGTFLLILTNDDGIHSYGIVTLGRYLSKTSTYMIAPERERTWCRPRRDAAQNPRDFFQEACTRSAYATNGTPADRVSASTSLAVSTLWSGHKHGTEQMGRDVNTRERWRRREGAFWESRRWPSPSGAFVSGVLDDGGATAPSWRGLRKEPFLRAPSSISIFPTFREKFSVFP